MGDVKQRAAIDGVRGRRRRHVELEKRAEADYTGSVPPSFKEFEAASLFCARCRRATPVRKKLLLVLPTGNKYDYTCGVCGSAVGGKTDSDPTDFYATAPTRPPGMNPPRSLR